MTEKEKKKESGEISRREFLKDAGLLVGGTAIGSTVLLAACGGGETVTKTTTKTVTSTTPGGTSTVTSTVPGGTSTKTVTSTAPGGTQTVTVEVPVSIPKSGYISWNPDECAACSRCLMTCAAVHEGGVAPQLSAIKWSEGNFFYGFQFRKPIFCQQCSYPECYFACPFDAIEIDSATGARYINKEKCTGCGICVEACPFEEPRINLNVENNVAIKCDLCKDRPEGPACIEVCNREALTLVPAEGRV